MKRLEKVVNLSRDYEGADEILLADARGSDGGGVKYRLLTRAARTVVFAFPAVQWFI